jgi:hypothetical protein
MLQAAEGADLAAANDYQGIIAADAFDAESEAEHRP